MCQHIKAQYPPLVDTDMPLLAYKRHIVPYLITQQTPKCTNNNRSREQIERIVRNQRCKCRNHGRTVVLGNGGTRSHISRGVRVAPYGKVYLTPGVQFPCCSSCGTNVGKDRTHQRTSWSSLSICADMVARSLKGDCCFLAQPTRFHLVTRTQKHTPSFSLVVHQRSTCDRCWVGRSCRLSDVHGDAGDEQFDDDLLNDESKSNYEADKVAEESGGRATWLKRY